MRFRVLLPCLSAILTLGSKLVSSMDDTADQAPSVLDLPTYDLSLIIVFNLV